MNQLQENIDFIQNTGIKIVKLIKLRNCKENGKKKVKEKKHLENY